MNLPVRGVKYVFGSTSHQCGAIARSDRLDSGCTVLQNTQQCNPHTVRISFEQCWRKEGLRRTSLLDLYGLTCVIYLHRLVPLSSLLCPERPALFQSLDTMTAIGPQDDDPNMRLHQTLRAILQPCSAPSRVLVFAECKIYLSSFI